MESAITPEANENKIVGTKRIKPIAPKAIGLSVKFRICQGIAQINTWFPTQPKTVPAQKIENCRYRRAGCSQEVHTYQEKSAYRRG